MPYLINEHTVITAQVLRSFCGAALFTGQVNLQGSDPNGLGIGDIDIIGASTNAASPRANLRFVALNKNSIKDSSGLLGDGDNMGGIQWLPNFSQTSAQISAEQVDSTGPFLTARIKFLINRVAASGNVIALQLEPSSTANDTLLMVFDVNSLTTKRVSVGAVDSGGAGFRLLRIPN